MASNLLAFAVDLGLLKVSRCCWEVKTVLLFRAACVAHQPCSFFFKMVRFEAAFNLRPPLIPSRRAHWKWTIFANFAQLGYTLLKSLKRTLRENWNTHSTLISKQLEDLLAYEVYLPLKLEHIDWYFHQLIKSIILLWIFFLSAVDNLASNNFFISQK